MPGLGYHYVVSTAGFDMGSKSQNPRATKIALAMLLIFLGIAAYGRAEVVCPLDSLHAASFPSALPVSFDEFKFTIGPDNSSGPDTSAASFRITNRDPRPINALFMVVDFYTSDRYLLSISFYLATSAEAASFKPAVPRTPWSASPEPLGSSLLRGQSYRPEEYSAIRPANCPDEARLAVLQVVFADGAVFDHRMAGWRVDPVLLSVKPWTLSGFPLKRASFSGRVSVDERGKARIVELIPIGSSASGESDVGESDPSDWLMDKIADTFTYAPALYDGSPISSEINLLIRFYPPEGADSTTSVPRDSVTPSVTVLDLLSPIPGKVYELRYGGYPFVGEGRREPKSP